LKQEDQMLLTVEKVMILKSVNIFAEIPDAVLAEVASIIEEVDIKKGELVFRKDDFGRSMYIIVDGKTRVHVGSKTIDVLGPRDVFGEMAALDPEPRSAGGPPPSNGPMN